MGNCNRCEEPINYRTCKYDPRDGEPVCDRCHRHAELARIRGIVDANREAGREMFAGLTSAEIGERNRAIMFGDDDEAFPSDAEWSAWVD